MDDRALLELAAKAAGLIVRWHSAGHYGPTMEIMNDEAGGPPWNPLTDDGDALRLAVKLGLCIDINPRFEVLVSYESEFDQISEPAKDDPCAATRRAIVRAAAETGKGLMPFPTAEEIEQFGNMHDKPEWDK